MTHIKTSLTYIYENKGCVLVKYTAQSVIKLASSIVDLATGKNERGRQIKGDEQYGMFVCPKWHPIPYMVHYL
jgi:hypothetical protein